ncbi:DUF4871 domain-containing protein [Paenibacillus chartarius]|uniref:DUF4871 domain-containing protein n=1 Tax=Paenibacillus chartarius TaxID=747481 RepID=A0ABV6DVL8_9BACL
MIEALPGGDLQAGLPAGAWWNLNLPKEDLAGKTIRIDALHDSTGTRLTELVPTKLTEANRYKDSLFRISSRLALPLPGVWTFQIYLDDLSTGSVDIEVPDGSWEPSTAFRSGTFEMTGVPDKLGILGPNFVAGKPNKYMWHFWGEPEKLTGQLEISAMKQGTNTLLSLFHAQLAPGKLNGADASMPSNLMLPSEGRWRLLAFIDGELLGSIVVDVAAQ